MNAAEADQDEQFGERFKVIPTQSRVNRQALPLMDQAFDVVAIFDDPPYDAFRNTYDDHGHKMIAVESSSPCVSIAHRSLPVAINHGDQFYRYATDELFEVKYARPDGVSRNYYGLVKLGLKAP